MIGSTRQVRVYAYRAPADMRKSFNTLGASSRRGLGGMSCRATVPLRRRGPNTREGAFLGRHGDLPVFEAARKGSIRRALAPTRRGPALAHATELALLLEGNELIARVPLSPAALYTPNARRLGWV